VSNKQEHDMTYLNNEEFWPAVYRTDSGLAKLATAEQFAANPWRYLSVSPGEIEPEADVRPLLPRQLAVANRLAREHQAALARQRKLAERPKPFRVPATLHIH
jgi:hypothetical protein